MTTGQGASRSKLDDSIELYMSKINQAVDHYADSIQTKLEKERAYKEKYRNRIKVLERHIKDFVDDRTKLMRQISRQKEENAKLKKQLKERPKSKVSNRTKVSYTAYIQYAGRSMKVGTFNTPEEAEKAEKRAIKAL